MTFDPDTVTINLGDTIEFGSLGYHNAVEVDESTWTANDTTSNGGFYFSLGSAGGYFIADSAKTYYYVCTPHVSLGMKAVIIVNIPIYGCTDSLAFNYNPLASIDDGSCIPILLYGCTDILALNYDSLATIDDGSCLYCMYGCMDSIAINFDALSTCNDSSCVYPLPTPSNLFFSEYGEGNSYNKYFEIYNPTSDTVDLSDFAFARVNGNPSTIGVYEYWNDFDSGSVILPNDVFVVMHVNADSLILLHADMTVSGSTALSNGDDGMALVFGNEPNSPAAPSSTSYVIVDWLGDFNGDPGQGWVVSGVNSGTRNHTLIRNCNVTYGDTSWTNSSANQWMVKSIDYWLDLGTHNWMTSVTDSVSFTICNGLSVSVGNNIYDSTGVYTDILTSHNGCDSIVITTLTVLTNSASIVVNNVIICDGDSIVVDSNSYFTSGTYVDTLVNSAGCDSIITTHLTVQTPTYSSFTICDGDSVVVGSSVYNSTGNYIDSVQSSIGCDSIIFTEVIVYSQFNSVFGGITNNTVGGGSFYSGQQSLELSCYMPSELVSAVIYSADTTLTTFEIRDNNGNVLDSVTANIIPGGHRIYFNYNMAAGSDYELGVNGGSNDLFRNNSGVSYPYNFGSLAAITSSSAGGNYYYFFYDIEVKQTSQPTNYSICDGDSISVAGNVYSTTGFYTDSLITSIGCDSLVFTNLMVYPNASSINNQTVCSGETYIFNGNVYDSSGTYTDSLHTIYGCDSIVTTHLVVDSISGGSGVNIHTICMGDSVSIGNHTYYHSGVYSDTLISSNGCDSVVTTTLNVITANYNSINGGLLDTNSVAGAFSNYDGALILDASVMTLLKSATVYSEDTNSVTFLLRDDNGVILQDVTHTVYPGAQSLNFNFIIPVGTDYELGIDGGNSGLYRSNVGGGNSIAYPFNVGAVSITSSGSGDQYYYFYYDMEFMSYATYNKVTICDGDSVIVGNNTYHTAGNYWNTFSSASNCDSLVFTDLSFYQSPSLDISSNPNPAEICLGDTITLEGSTGFDQYYWISENAVIGQNQQIELSPSQDFWYLLKAIDSNGCVSSEEIMVYVDTCATSIDGKLITNIFVYPNPSSGLFTLELNNIIEKNTILKIVNSVGEVICTEKVEIGERTKNINISKYSKGIYFIEIETKNRIINKKLILQ